MCRGGNGRSAGIKSRVVGGESDREAPFVGTWQANVAPVKLLVTRERRLRRKDSDWRPQPMHLCTGRSTALFLGNLRLHKMDSPLPENNLIKNELHEALLIPLYHWV